MLVCVGVVACVHLLSCCVCRINASVASSFLSSAPSPLSLCSFGDGWSLIDFYLSFVVYLFIYLSCMLVCVGVRCLVACCVRCLYGCAVSCRCVSCACVRLLLSCLFSLLYVRTAAGTDFWIFFWCVRSRTDGTGVRAGRRNYLQYVTSL